MAKGPEQKTGSLDDPNTLVCVNVGGPTGASCQPMTKKEADAYNKVLEAEIVAAVIAELPASGRLAIGIWRSQANANKTGETGDRFISDFLRKYLEGRGGRWGSSKTRVQNDKIASQLEAEGYRVTGGAGRASEEWIPGPGGSTQGGTFVDITATNGRITIRIQTVTTRANGVPTAGEAAAAERIKNAFPNDELILIPKE